MVAGDDDQRVGQVRGGQQPGQKAVEDLQVVHGACQVTTVPQHIGHPVLEEDKIVGLGDLPQLRAASLGSKT